MKNSEIIKLVMDKKDIALLKFIFEASEGTGLTSTVDAKKGEVIIMTPPGGKDAAFEILDSISDMISFKVL